ncbi:MAG TPA: RNA polymerase sigma factor [Tepidisphaeraceae bacterium]|jgi:RNA polymerase sigma-70 factor (ECF subfamily)|nr:RNA polymerase sigma factor [Tepidisphaeraceae bacterium]
MNRQSDQTLVEQGQAGNQAAFEELVRRSARWLFARIYLETGDAHRAEDLVQETFLQAWRSIRSLSDPRTFRGWLNTIAQRVVIDAARRDSRKKRGRGAKQEGDALLTIASNSPAPPDALEREDERQRVLAILRSLPEEYRIPLMLRYIGGADYDAIANELALSNGSLRGLLQRGLKMLREKLDREERRSPRLL